MSQIILSVIHVIYNINLWDLIVIHAPTFNVEVKEKVYLYF